MPSNPFKAEPSGTRLALNRIGLRVRNLERRFQPPSSIGVTTEIFEVDSSDSVGGSTTSVLENGVKYLVTIQGTFTAWNEILNDGSPEADAMFPGSTVGRVSTEVGIDAETMFAWPSDAPPPVGAMAHHTIQMDIGSGWQPLQAADDGVHSTPVPGHLYSYTMTGAGSVLKLKVNDTSYTDNYGKLRVVVQQIDPGSGGGTGGGGGTGSGSLVPAADSSMSGEVLTVDPSGIPAWKTTALEVTDGTHTVTGVTELDFTSGATVTDAGGGVAHVAVTGSGGTSLGWVNVKDHGAVGNVTTVGTGGTDDTAAFNAALAALPTVNGYPAGTIYVPAGVYRINGDINNLGPFVSILGDGKWASILDYRGSAQCLRIYDSTYPPSGSAYSFFGGGSLRHFGIAGDGAAAGSSGLHAGDVQQLELDIYVQGFAAGASTFGVHFDNTVSWTERITGRIICRNCRTAVVFDVSGATTSTNSFDYIDLAIDILATTDSVGGQNGVTIQNGAQLASGRLRITGNFGNTSTGSSAAALSIKGQVPTAHPGAGGYSNILGCQLDIACELDGSGSVLPYTIFFGTTGSAGNTITGCTGVMAFTGNAWHNSNNSSNLVSYLGIIKGDTALESHNAWTPCTIGGFNNP